MSKSQQKQRKSGEPYSEEERKVHVQSWQRAEVSISDYCRDHGIAPSTFYDWVHQYVGKLNKERLKLPFSGIQVVDEAEDSRGMRAAVKIKLPSGIRIELASCPDVETVLAMIQGLSACN